MLHLSVDDFFMTLRELTENEAQYASLFEHPIFAFFREMHEKYGTVFHCYCFGEERLPSEEAELAENLLQEEATQVGSFTLADVTRKYRSEFEQNAAWLQFGFHGMNYDAVYGDNGGTRVINRDAKQAAEDYAFVMGQLAEIVGEKALDFNPRIHFFAGTRECCQAWKNAKYGIEGLLAADDTRYSYYHNTEQHDKLMAENVWHDAELDVTFRRTNIRLENEKDLEGLRRKIKDFKGDMQVVFTHECYLQQEEMKQKIAICLQEANHA